MVDKLNMSIKRWWNDTDRRRQKCLQKKTLSATNPTWAGVGLNPPFQGKMPPSNCLNHGAAWKEVVLADLLGGNKKKKNKETLVRLRAKIWSRDIPIMYQAYQTFNHDIRYQ